MILQTYARVFVDAEALERTVAFYRALLGGEETLRFAYPQTQMEFAAVSSPRLSVLIIASARSAPAAPSPRPHFFFGIYRSVNVPA